MNDEKIQLLIEEVKNRPDKSTLEIYSQCPEVLLAPAVSSPELVKHLNLYLHFNSDCYDEAPMRQGKFCAIGHFL
jgi:hypothetical protein